MPTATAPVGKAAKPARPGAKPAGFTKPAGFRRPADDLDEEEEKPAHPTVLVCAIVAVLVLLFVAYQQYSIDGTISRVTEPMMGWPESSASADVSSDDDSSSEEEHDDSEEEGEE